MKDRQIIRKPETSHIPILSVLLHVWTMPTLVILRYQFGYRFLSPKAIFLSLCWAMGLFTVYSHFEPTKWSSSPIIFSFMLASAILYVFHLLSAVKGQWGKAPHDQFSGLSWLGHLSPNDNRTRLWFEPVFILLAAICIKLLTTEILLYKYLILAAPSLFVKEAINRWAKLRRIKQQTDATDDAEDTMSKLVELRESSKSSPDQSSPVTTRVTKKKRPRTPTELPANNQLIETHAAILRMLPPYSLEQAEENFRKLSEIENENNSSFDEKSLIRAIKFFQHLYSI